MSVYVSKVFSFKVIENMKLITVSFVIQKAFIELDVISLLCYFKKKKDSSKLAVGTNPEDNKSLKKNIILVSREDVYLWDNL